MICTLFLYEPREIDTLLGSFMVDSKNKWTLSPPGRCGFPRTASAQLETVPTNLECLINSKIYYNSPVVRSSGQGYGGARYPAYGLGAFRNQSKNQKLNVPNTLLLP